MSTPPHCDDEAPLHAQSAVGLAQCYCITGKDVSSAANWRAAWDVSAFPARLHSETQSAGRHRRHPTVSTAAHGTATNAPVAWPATVVDFGVTFVVQPCPAAFAVLPHGPSSERTGECAPEGLQPRMGSMRGRNRGFCNRDNSLMSLAWPL